MYADPTLHPTNGGRLHGRFAELFCLNPEVDQLTCWLTDRDVHALGNCPKLQTAVAEYPFYRLPNGLNGLLPRRQDIIEMGKDSVEGFLQKPLRGVCLPDSLHDVWPNISSHVPGSGVAQQPQEVLDIGEHRQSEVVDPDLPGPKLTYLFVYEPWQPIEGIQQPVNPIQPLSLIELSQGPGLSVLLRSNPAKNNVH